MAPSQEPHVQRNGAGAVFAWCFPCMLAFVLFLFSFPIDRAIPFWPRWSIAETFYFWFIFPAPIASVIAFVVFLRRRHIASFTRKLIWMTLSISLLVNGFMLIAIWAAFYF